MPIGSLRMPCLDCLSRATVSRLLLRTDPQVLLNLSAFDLRTGVNMESSLPGMLINVSSMFTCHLVLVPIFHVQ